MPDMKIDYSQELPPTQGPNVRSHLNTDTGAGEMWGQVAKMGGAISDIGLDVFDKIQRAKEYGDFVDAKLAMEQKSAALFDTLPTVGDQAARAKAFQAHQQEMAPYLSAKNQRIVTAAKESQASDAIKMMHFERTIQIGEQKDRMDIQLPQLLAKMDEKGYKDAATAYYTEGLITQPEWEDRVTNYDLDSRTARADVIAGSDPAGAMDLLKGATAPDQKRADRLDTVLRKANGFANASKQKQEEDNQKLTIGATVNVAKQADKVKRMQAIEEARKVPATAFKSDGEARAYYNWLDSQAEGTKGMSTDADLEVSLMRRARAAETPEEFAAVDKDTADAYHAGKMSDAKYLSLMDDTDKGRKTKEKNTLMQNIDIGIGTQGIGVDHQPALIRKIESLAQQEKWTSDQQPEKIAKIIVGYKADLARANEEIPKLTESNKQLLGEVAQKGSNITVGGVKKFVLYSEQLKSDQTKPSWWVRPAIEWDEGSYAKTHPQGVTDESKWVADHLTLNMGVHWARSPEAVETYFRSYPNAKLTGVAAQDAAGYKSRLPGAASQSSIPQIHSDAEYDALPTGPYLAPDGTKRMKK